MALEKFPTLTIDPNANTGAPSKNMSLTDLTKWMQNNASLNAYNWGNYYQSNAKAAQDAASQGLDNYMSSVQGLQGLYSNLTNQAQAATKQGQTQQNQANNWYQNAMQYYNPAQQQHNIQSGTVPDATKQYLQNIYDSQMANLQNDLNKAYSLEQRRVQDNLGARGVLNSQTAANALAQMMQNKGDQLLFGANTYNTQLMQNLVDAPYKQLEANIQNLGAQTGAAQGLSGIANQWLQSQLSGMNSQAQWGAQVPQAMAKGYQMAKGMYDIPAAMYQQYNNQLQDLWGNLGNWSTEIERAKIAAGDAGSDGDWMTGIGGLIGAIGGLF